MITKFKIFENADDIEIIDKETGEKEYLDHVTENSFSFMCETADDELFVFEYKTHQDFFLENQLYDYDEIKSMVINNTLNYTNWDFDESDFDSKEEYEMEITEMIYHYIEEELIFEWIRGRVWTDQKVIGFWKVIDKDDLMKIIKKLNRELNLNIDDDWLIHLSMKFNEETYKFIHKYSTIGEYTKDLITPEMEKEMKEREKLHILKGKDKWNALRKLGYKPKHKSDNMIDAEYNDKSTRYKFTESQNTEGDDHRVNQNVNISNDKKFGVPTPTQLPLDYYGIADEDGDVDEDDDYYSTSAGRDGLYHGTEPGHNKGLNARSTAVYKMSAESVLSFNDYNTNESRTQVTYRGFLMLKNSDLSPGSEGYWNIPKLFYRDFANKIVQGYDTISITQGKDIIDEWYDFNQKVKVYKTNENVTFNNEDKDSIIYKFIVNLEDYMKIYNKKVPEFFMIFLLFEGDNDNDHYYFFQLTYNHHVVKEFRVYDKWSLDDIINKILDGRNAFGTDYNEITDTFLKNFINEYYSKEWKSIDPESYRTYLKNKEIKKFKI